MANGWLTTQDGGEALFRGIFATAVDDGTLDIAILGRDITNLFAVVIDWPGDAVRLLWGNDPIKSSSARLKASCRW